MIKYFLLLPSLLLYFTISLSAQNVASSADKVNPLLINAKVPDVSLQSIDGETVKLREKISEKPAIVIFYRGGWCPYCNSHLSDLQQIEDPLRELGYQIIAISPDRPEKLKVSLSKNDLEYTLMSDSPMNVTKAFGLAFKVEESLVTKYKEDYGIDLEADSGFDHHLLPAPAVYILDTDGTVLFNYVNPNYRERIHGDILLAAAKVYSAS